jgi:hypothetical protein
MWERLYVKYPLFLSDFNETLIFATDFRKKSHIVSKSIQWEPSCSMPTDGHDEANSHFSQFCERAYKPVSVVWGKIRCFLRYAYKPYQGSLRRMQNFWILKLRVRKVTAKL